MQRAGSGRHAHMAHPAGAGCAQSPLPAHAALLHAHARPPQPAIREVGQLPERYGGAGNVGWSSPTQVSAAALAGSLRQPRMRRPGGDGELGSCGGVRAARGRRGWLGGARLLIVGRPGLGDAHGAHGHLQRKLVCAQHAVDRVPAAPEASRRRRAPHAGRWTGPIRTAGSAQGSASLRTLRRCVCLGAGFGCHVPHGTTRATPARVGDAGRLACSDRQRVA